LRFTVSIQRSTRIGRPRRYRDGMRLVDPARPLMVDGVLAIALFVATQVELWVLQTPIGPRPLLAAIAVLACAPLILRRRAPLIALAGVLASVLLPLPFGFGQVTTTEPGLFSALATMIAVHAVAAYTSLRTAAAAAGVLLAAQYLMLLSLPARSSGDWLVLTTLVCAAFLAGRVQANQRVSMARQSRRAHERLLEEQAREQQVRTQERRQIARELHDVIAHGVAVMVVQAGAAEALLDTDHAHARDMLRAVQNSGAQAGTELARLLQLLGQDLDSSMVPSPTLRDLPDLVADLRVGGLSVELRQEKQPVPTAAGLELAAYRIVQEALTNVVKHAPGARADVQVSTAGNVLQIVVTDQGGIREAARTDLKSGHGLLGMRERVELYGGTMTVGRTANGFIVKALVPINNDVGTSLGSADVATAAR
jgi:signal transduction histidine kinase